MRRTGSHLRKLRWIEPVNGVESQQEYQLDSCITTDRMLGNGDDSMGLLDGAAIWAIGFLILIALGQGIEGIRKYEKRMKQKWWNRHREMDKKMVFLKATDPAQDEIHSFVMKMDMDYNVERKKFEAGQRDRDLKKTWYFLLMLCDAVATLTLCLWAFAR